MKVMWGGVGGTDVALARLIVKVLKLWCHWESI